MGLVQYKEATQLFHLTFLLCSTTVMTFTLHLFLLCSTAQSMWLRVFFFPLKVYGESWTVLILVSFEDFVSREN
jgi:hypothetical protein